MREKLPVLFEGHAPFALHEAFDAALAQFEAWGLGDDEPTVVLDGAELPISAVFGRMRGCTDLLPIRFVGDIEALTGQPLEAASGAVSFADAARVLRAMCVEQLKGRMPRAATLSAAAINATRNARTRLEG